MRQIITACALAIATSGVAQSTLPPPHRGAATAKPWLNPSLTYGSVTDIDGNTYATIEIGKQVWMAENLRTTRYRNGDPIPNVTDDRKWTDLSSGAWCHYENDPKYEVPYGKLYNWYTVNDPRKACPAGWHVPTDAEWYVLENSLGDGPGWKMKTTTLWPPFTPPAGNGATNESGFSGLPGGDRNDLYGSFLALGDVGRWWSASESGAEDAWGRTLLSRYGLINGDPGGKSYGLSVRCLRD